MDKVNATSLIMTSNFFSDLFLYKMERYSLHVMYNQFLTYS